MYDAKKAKELLSKRLDVRCNCNKKMPNKNRAKYGTCECDAFSFNYTFGVIMSNALLQYIADTSQRIVRDDWEVIEAHAFAIRDYATIDVDVFNEDVHDRNKYLKITKKWREAMFWLTENWEGLWW
jgi:hypothetical protein